MKILLTGKNGQVGYELERSLQCAGEVIAVDRSQMDLSNPDQISEVIQQVRPQLIVNAAAYTAVDKAELEMEAAMLINAQAPLVMAQEAKKIGAAMIHYSTDYVFDGEKAGPYAEDDVPAPLNSYGLSKLQGERAIASVGIPYLIFRTSWVYGKRGHNFLLTILRLAQERDELHIVADQYGAPTWCRTIADATASVIAQLGTDKKGVLPDRWQSCSGIYHLTAQGSTTWHGFALEILRCSTGHKNPVVHRISTADYPLPAKRPMNSQLSSQRLIDGFCYLPTWQESLKTCLF